MLIAIMSDSHEDSPGLKRAIGIAREKGAEAIVHCGDFLSPDSVSALEDSGIPVHVVLGNCDSRSIAGAVLRNAKNITLHGDVMMAEFGKKKKKKIAAAHLPGIADALFRSRKLDLVCYGHTHQRSLRREGDSMIINPGEIMGRKGRPSFALYDTDDNDVAFIEF